MSKANTNKILGILNSKWGSNICPACKSGGMAVEDTIFELREFNNGALVMGGGQSIYPVVPCVCNQCGYILFINHKIVDAMQ